MSATRLFPILKMLVVLFWLVMLGLLIQRIHLLPGIETPEAPVLADSETWMSVYFKGQKAGYSYQSLTRLEKGYVVDQKSFLQLNLMGTVQELRTVTSAVLNPDLALQSFNFFMSAGPIRYQLTGRMNGLELELTTMTAGHKNQSVMRLDEPPRLAMGLNAYLVRHGLEPGARFQVPIFDPSTLSMRPIRATVEGLETLDIDGRPVEAYRIRQEYFDTQSYVWVDRQGRSVKEEGLLGLSMVRTTAEKAQSGLTGRAELIDVVEATSAPTNRQLDAPREISFLKARLKGLELDGFELDGGRQVLKGDVVEVASEKIDVRQEARLPLNQPAMAEYLEPTAFIQSRDPRIVARARALAGGEASPLKAIDAVIGWVYDHLEKRPTMSVPSAVDVLETGTGDCNEHAVLAAAVLRACGVPCRMAVGVLYFEGRFYYHAWLEAYWGRWLAVDPLLGQIPADATHIRFLTGDLSRQTDMMRVIGRLEVEILEAR